MNSRGNFSIYLGSGVIAGLLPLLLIPLLTRVLDPADYGRMAMLLTLVAMIGPVVAWGISAFSIMQSVRSPKELLPGVLGASLVNTVFVVLLLTIVFGVFGDWIGGMLSLPGEWIALVPIMAASSILPQLFDSILTIQRRALVFAGFEIAGAATNLGLTLLLVVVLAAGWAGRIEAMVATNLVLSTVALVALVKMGVLRPKVDRGTMVPAMRFGTGVVIITESDLLIRFSDRLLVAAFVGIVAAGHYAVAGQLSTFMVFLLSAMRRVWTPYLFRALQDGKDEILIVRRSYLVIALFIACFLAYNLVLTVVYPLLIPAEYHSSMPFVFWLTLGYLFNGISVVFRDYIIFHGNTRYLAFVSVFSFAAFLCTALLLIAPLGAKGVAIAFALASGMGTCLDFVISYRMQPMPWLRALLLWRWRAS